MAWQVRHRSHGVFMGVNHGKAHYHGSSECCRSLGVYRFERSDQIEAFIEYAGSPHLPEQSRSKPEDFVVEEWSFPLDDLLHDEGLVDSIQEFLQWSFSVFPVGNN